MDEKDLFEEGKKMSLMEAATNRTKEDVLYSVERF